MTRFSLRALLAVVAFVAAWLAAMAFPPAVRSLVDAALRVMIVAVLLTMIIYARGSRQAFAIGAFVPTVVYLFEGHLRLNLPIFLYQKPAGWVTPIAGWLPLVVVTGLVCMWVHSKVIQGSEKDGL